MSRSILIAVHVSPPPDLSGGGFGVWLNKRKKKMEICATSPLFLGVGPQGPLPGDFPAAGGLLPFHAFRGAAAVPARHQLVLDAGVVGVQSGPLCNFSFVLDFSVRSQI
jgi:hypothetical protein